MRKNLLLVLLLAAALFSAGCVRGMVNASNIQPAVDLVVKDYVTLKVEQATTKPLPDPHWEKKVALARELKATVDLAAGGDE